jgi:hypothetical protein
MCGSFAKPGDDLFREVWLSQLVPSAREAVKEKREQEGTPPFSQGDTSRRDGEFLQLHWQFLI